MFPLIPARRAEGLPGLRARGAAAPWTVLDVNPSLGGSQWGRPKKGMTPNGKPSITNGRFTIPPIPPSYGDFMGI